jgi:WD40 repeat protein
MGGVFPSPSVYRADSFHRKGVSFLSRIMGGKKPREDIFDLKDNESEISDNRPSGMDAEIFSQPMGFMPTFPPPPKYIKVKAQNRKRRDFDKVFLAQVLLGRTKDRSSSDAKIVSITDVSQLPTAPGPPTNRAIWAMEFSKDGKYLAAAGQDKKVRVWQVISSPEDREAEEKDFNASSEGGEKMKLNAPVFKTKLLREYEGHTSSILDLSWSKNNFLLSSSMDKTVRLYHVSRTECLCAFKHNDFVTSVQFHPRDDRFFLAGSLDSKLRLWSIPDKSVAFWAQVPDMVTAVAFTPDGKTAIAGCLNGLCILYDTEGLKAHSQIHVRSARGRNAKGSKITGIDTIALPREQGSPDIKLLITSNDSRVRMYNLKDRNLEVKFRGNENASSQIHASFSDDGKYVICGSEDRKVYIWSTGPVEKQDPEKRPVELFEAHSAMVTTAILAPTATRQALARSGDPLYDLCNPPPVTLLSRTDSVISSRAPTESGSHQGSGKEQENKSSPRNSGSPRRAPETPAYKAKSAHMGGNIIVTADYSGQIKIFRQDCAFEKRRQESWDTQSTFSKKMLGRSGSVTTRTSASSNRLSLNSNKNPSADRINNWRHSIASNGSTSMANSMSETNINRTRSNSPKKSFQQRFSLGNKSHQPTPLITARSSPPVTPPEDKASSPRFETPPTHRQSGAQHNPDISIAAPSPISPDDNGAGSKYHPVPRDADDPLWLQGQQSFQYYNVKSNFAQMAMRDARTPGLLDPNMRNPLSRQNSVVSQLSSEMVSSGDSGGEEQEAAGIQRRDSRVSTTSGDGEELKCSDCGSRSFKAVKSSEGGQRLKCTRCGKAV